MSGTREESPLAKTFPAGPTWSQESITTFLRQMRMCFKLTEVKES